MIQVLPKLNICPSKLFTDIYKDLKGWCVVRPDNILIQRSCLMILLVVEPQLGKMSVRKGLKEKYKRNFHSVTNEIIYS